MVLYADFTPYLAQVEELLKEKEVTSSGSNFVPIIETFDAANGAFFQDLGLEGPFVQEDPIFSSVEPEAQFTQSRSHVEVFPQSSQDNQTGVFLTEEFSWAMIELGVQEPLPPQDTIDELFGPFSYW
jgi:hypothetical protein